MFLLLFVAWMIFNSKITLEIVFFGLAISTAVFAFICKFMDYSIQKEVRLYKNFFWFIRYIFILLWEIIKANGVVIKLMTTARYDLEPVIVSFKSPVKGSVSKVILANSITLTPGTITVSVEGEEFRVHCLDSSLAEGLDSSVFVKEIKKIDREGK